MPLTTKKLNHILANYRKMYAGRQQNVTLVLRTTSVPAAPTLSLLAYPNLGTGQYSYAVTWVSAAGESGAGATATITTTAGNQGVNVQSIPIGPAGTTARRLYRSKVGSGSPLLLVPTGFSLADNTTLNYADANADNTLGQTSPPGLGTNTLQINGIWRVMEDADPTLSEINIAVMRTAEKPDVIAHFLESDISLAQLRSCIYAYPTTPVGVNPANHFLLAHVDVRGLQPGGSQLITYWMRQH